VKNQFGNLQKILGKFLGKILGNLWQNLPIIREKPLKKPDNFFWKISADFCAQIPNIFWLLRRALCM